MSGFTTMGGRGKDPYSREAVLLDLQSDQDSAITFTLNMHVDQGQVVSHGGAQWRAKASGKVPATAEPGVGSNWPDMFAPYNPTLKPIFVASNSPLINYNGALLDYTNITQGNFFGKINQSYDYSRLRPDILFDKFVKSGKAYKTMTYRPHMRQLFPLDVENGPAGVYTLRSINNPRWTQQLSGMAEMAEVCRAAGLPACFYMNQHQDFANNKAMFQRQFLQHNWPGGLDKLADRNAFNRIDDYIAERFRTHVDIVSYRGYTVDDVQALDGQGHDIMWYHMDMNLRKMKLLYPDHLRLVWLQPNNVTNFDPLSLGAWNHMVDWCLHNDDVDGIVIFYLDDKTQPAGWEAAFAPDYQKVVTATTGGPIVVTATKAPSSTPNDTGEITFTGGPTVAAQEVTLSTKDANSAGTDVQNVTLPIGTSAGAAAALVASAVSDPYVTATVVSGHILRLTPGVGSYLETMTVSIANA